MDLQEPTNKMSTTGGNEAGTVLVLDEPKTVTKKIKSAVTDSGSEVKRGDGKEGIANLIQILAVARGTSEDEVEREFEGSGYGDFKGAVAEAVVDLLAPGPRALRGAAARRSRTRARHSPRAPRRPARSPRATLAEVRSAIGIGPA